MVSISSDEARKLTLSARKNDLERIFEEIRMAAFSGKSSVNVPVHDPEIVGTFLSTPSGGGFNAYPIKSDSFEGLWIIW